MEAKAGPSDRMVGLLLAILILAGTVLRTVDIEREALWADEALTLAIVRLPIFDLMFRPVDPTPGLYYTLHKLFVPVGAGPGETRLVALLAGILTIPAGYWLGRAAIDRRAGLGVAAMITFSAWLVDYSQEARAYALLVLLTTSAAAALIDAFPTTAARTVRWRMLILSLILGLAAVYTHLVGWLWTVPALLLAAIECDRRGQLPKGAVLAGGLVVVAVTLPEFLRLADYALSPRNAFNWLEQPDASRFIFVLGRLLTPTFLIHQVLDWFPFPFGTLVLAVSAVGIGVWVVWAIAVAVKQRGRQGKGRFIAVGAIAILLSIPAQAMIIGEILNPILIERTILPILPAFYVLIASLASLRGRTVAMSIAVAINAADCLALGFVRQKSGWSETALAINAAGQAGKPVVVCPSWRAPALIHALRQSGSAAPVIVYNGYGAALILEQGGAAPNWINGYVDLAWRRKLPAYADEPKPIPETIGLQSSSWILINADCHPQELAAVINWLGAGQRSLIAQVRQGEEVDLIRVEEFRPADSGVRPVIVRLRATR